MSTTVSAKLVRAFDDWTTGELSADRELLQFTSKNIDYKIDISNVNYLKIEEKLRWMWFVSLLAVAGVLIMIAGFAVERILILISLGVFGMTGFVLLLAYLLKQYHLVVATNGEEIEFAIGSAEEMDAIRGYYDGYLT